MKPADYIDFKDMRKNFKKKKLIQPMKPDEFIDRLEQYFEKYNKYNLYSLSLHFGMTDYRFTNHYLKSDNKELASLANQAMNAITSHCLDNGEEYKRSMRYIMSRQNTGKDFIELDESVQQSQAAVLVLPPKD